MQKATENQLAQESATAKGSRPELTEYLEEIPLVIDWDASPEEQAEAILKWWKVRLRVINFLFSFVNNVDQSLDVEQCCMLPDPKPYRTRLSTCSRVFCAL